MTRYRFAFVGHAALVFLTLSSPPTFAQGTITGSAKDTTGSVLPGVTVEASSPVLIEKARTVVTDGEGLYKIVDLRPGSYTVSFSLPGFATVKRENIQLTGAFTATVNAEMRVGSLEETVTVSGASPMVDTQSVVNNKVMSNEVLDTIPTGSRAYGNFAVLIPGVTTSDGQDVGGTLPYIVRFAVHGSRTSDTILAIDGLSYTAGGTTSGRTGLHVNEGMVEEVSLELGGLSAENPLGGIVTNVIPKEGGAEFLGTFVAAGTNHRFQADNLTQALKNRGLTAQNHLKKNWDVNLSMGGPLLRDRLWWFGSVRHWGTDNYIAGLYYNLTPNSFSYTPDLSRQSDTDVKLGSQNIRWTWQVSPRNKFNLYYENQQFVNSNFSGFATNSPEATTRTVWTPDYVAQATWTSPLTNRLFLQAGGNFVDFDYTQSSRKDTGLLPTTVAKVEQSTGFAWGAFPSNLTPHSAGKQVNMRAAVSYVTGSHNIKVGAQYAKGWSHFTKEQPGGYVLGLLNGVPNRITQYATPFVFDENLKDNLGLYAQDQWRIKRVTLDLGARFDYLNGYVPAQDQGWGEFVPARHFDPVYNVPNWKDVSPRLGIAFDLFGTGKTALKGSVGRYVGGIDVANFTRQANPVSASLQSANRTWTDTNGNGIPDCDLNDRAANGLVDRCGALSNQFGLINATASRYDPSVTTNRPFSWEASGGLQHELFANLSIDVGYFRRWYGNTTTTDNLAVTPADYDPFCIDAPVDSRLPGGGGNQICGLYDLNPAKFGQVNNLIILSQNTEVYNGVDISATARLPQGVRFSGGLNSGRVATDSCVVVDSPQQKLFCHVTPPFRTQLKVYAIYPLPWWGLQTSATYQGVAGPTITAGYTARSAETTLTRNLVNGPATLPLVQPGTMFVGWFHEIDYRTTKIFKFGSRRLQVNFDLFNLFNASSVLAVNNTYGSQWQRPTSILQGRLVKFGAEFDF